MGFVPSRSRSVFVLAVLSTAALLLVGNGINPVWPLMWLAFIPVLLLAATTPSWQVAGGGAALAMLLGSGEMLYYLHFVLGAPVRAWLIPFSIASLLFAAGVLLFRALLRRGAMFSAVVALPAFWTLCEYAASFVPANGTAGSLAYTQERFLPMLQLASLTGPWGITFVLLLFPACLTASIYLWRRKPSASAAVLATALAVIGGAVLFGVVRLESSGGEPTLKVALLDTDAVEFAGSSNTMQALAQQYAAQADALTQRGATIVVMPEKTGLLLEQDTSKIDNLFQAVSDRSGATLVIGMTHVVGRDSYNRVRIYRPEQPVASYDKQHMLPPFESNLTPGRSLTLLPSPNAPIGIAICKDMDFIHPALDYGRAGIGLLLDPAWDFNFDRAWHGHIAIMRGVEGGYAIAHAAKDGFLTVTDNRGRILGEVQTGKQRFTSLLVDAPIHHDETVFDRYGAWFPWMAGLLLLGAIARLATKHRATPERAREEDLSKSAV